MVSFFILRKHFIVKEIWLFDYYFFIDYSCCFLYVLKLRQYCRFPGIKANFLPGFGPLVHLLVAPSIQRLIPGSCWMVGKREKQPVIFKHKWQHAVRVNARCHKSATTLVKAQSSAWWHKCDTPLPKVCCRSPNFRSHYTTWTRLWSRVNIVITWFNLKSLLCWDGGADSFNPETAPLKLVSLGDFMGIVYDCIFKRF